ncbi:MULTISPECIES: dihydrofolate reductase family protein [unclassified Gordonia (in: high G+C Gram-positive bacteria)]|mgnify:CR=1 FL=1|uniref:dihydrofolate reductase family protein n=1 Tax=unclassified Gordonia (in: high G+C Gram-positive bacteria) TaxID=2657482 RepID=UPI001F0D9774|nr:dihydrofolate reductase family protein [Gordonia sp. ABSL49_1]MCH5642976.1 dihydrofolate reductase family protein [Gordonia sp. ABSL49_1]
MGKIHVHEFVSLDGVFEDPRFTMPYGFPEAQGAVLSSFMSECTGILLGRNTFEMFAPAWSTRTADEDPGAPFFNDSTKYVVTSASEVDSWQNSQVLGTYDADRIRELKSAENLYVSGSGTLVRAMLADGLVDELHLLVYPVVLGTGARLFEDMSKTGLRLVDHDVFDNGVLHLSYGPAD